MTAIENQRFNAVLDYWFGSTDRQNPVANFELWYSGTAEIDAHITATFGEELKLAEAGKLDEWKQEPHAALALVILLDQFALNIHRDLPEGYHDSKAAIQYTYGAVASGHDSKVHAKMRPFYYMPLMHSERLVDQEKCVELFNARCSANEYAVIHRDIVKKYGRFPGRNKVMGRQSSAAEEEYLKNGGVF